eukprot:198674_1
MGKCTSCCKPELYISDDEFGLCPGNLKSQLSVDQRRLVFVSLSGLYQTWDTCPKSQLHSSIFMLPLKREWIHHPSKYQKQICGERTTFKDKKRFKQFIQLLKWKERQNLAFWMLDEYETNEEGKLQDNQLVAGFWRHFNAKLCQLYDPSSQTRYKSLTFDSRFWRFTYNRSLSRYHTPAYKILSELYFVTKQFKATQELIYQSNPNSLNPIVSYNPYENHCIASDSSQPHKPGFMSRSHDQISDFAGFVPFLNGCCPDFDDDDDEKDENEGIWMISRDYNEYELD